MQGLWAQPVLAFALIENDVSHRKNLLVKVLSVSVSRLFRRVIFLNHLLFEFDTLSQRYMGISKRQKLCKQFIINIVLFRNQNVKCSINLLPQSIACLIKYLKLHIYSRTGYCRKKQQITFLCETFCQKEQVTSYNVVSTAS